MPEQSVSPPRAKVRLPGLDPDATPVIGLGLGLAGLLLGLRPRLAPWPLAAAAAAAALLYRDPQRHTPQVAGALFAPADGTVLAVDEQYEHRFLHTDAVRLTIRVSPLDVPVLRSPLAGVVTYLEHIAGEPPWQLYSSGRARRERQYIGISGDEGLVLLSITAGPLARHIRRHVALGERVLAGARLATARFGSSVELLLPRDIVEAMPVRGDMLQAGVSPVGEVAPL
ncbi:MAG: hypothetical protein RLZZ387_4776 [Chloroflexota bacterium]|jgi:phosphatidylserine decarboxylase